MPDAAPSGKPWRARDAAGASRSGHASRPQPSATSPSAATAPPTPTALPELGTEPLPSPETPSPEAEGTPQPSPEGETELPSPQLVTPVPTVVQEFMEPLPTWTPLVDLEPPTTETKPSNWPVIAGFILQGVALLLGAAAFLRRR